MSCCGGLPNKWECGLTKNQVYCKKLWLGGWSFILAELHADLFSRHASPLEVCVFVAIDERGEDVMSDEICRRCNGKQRRRRRSGQSVQLPDWFMIRHSCSRHLLCKYTYVLRSTKYIQRKQVIKETGVQVSEWTCSTCVQNFRVYLLKTAWAFGLLCVKYVYFT